MSYTSWTQTRSRTNDKQQSLDLRREVMANEMEQIKESGNQARLTARQTSRFNANNQTANNRATNASFRDRTRMSGQGNRLNFQSRRYGNDVRREGNNLRFQEGMYGSDVRRERNMMSYDTEQERSRLARDKFGWDRQREAAVFNQKREVDDRFDYYDEKSGQQVTGRWSDRTNPGKKLQSRLAGAKDKEAEFAKFSPGERDIFRKYDTFMQGQLNPGAASYQNEMTGRGIDTSGWSANRLRRSMGENRNRGANQRLVNMGMRNSREEYQGSRGYQGMGPYVSVSDTGGRGDSQQVRDTISALRIQDRNRQTPATKVGATTQAKTSPTKRKPAITSIPSQPSMSSNVGYRQPMFNSSVTPKLTTSERRMTPQPGQKFFPTTRKLFKKELKNRDPYGIYGAL